MKIGDYYTSLTPFLPLFEQGLPILTYHKLGNRPKNVRLKGLYVSALMFDTQLCELKQAGFTSGSLSDISGASASAPSRRVVISFDDGFANAFVHSLEPLARHGFRAIQYLVSNRLGRKNEWDIPAGEASARLMDEMQVREWLAAGHEIGSHTMTHPILDELSTADAQREIRDSKKQLEDLFRVPIRHFCYPHGRWNAALANMVAEAGYQTATTTDWGVNPPGSPPFELKRLTARYRSRNWKNLLAWLGWKT